MHANGVIGHFSIGDEGKADLKLLPEATQFLVLEAKMFSGLSPTVNNARYYDQAARNVACMAEVLCRAERNPSFEGTLAVEDEEQVVYARCVFGKESLRFKDSLSGGAGRKTYVFTVRLAL